MGTDFFEGLGETITRTAKELGGKAETFYGSQKIRNKMAGESRIMDKLMADLGNIIYHQYLQGSELDHDQKILCEQIDQHMQRMAKYKADMADMKGEKICSCCEHSIDRNAIFCPYCGAACTTQEAEQEAGDVVVTMFHEEIKETEEEPEKTEETSEVKENPETEEYLGAETAFSWEPAEEVSPEKNGE